MPKPMIKASQLDLEDAKISAIRAGFASLAKAARAYCMTIDQAIEERPWEHETETFKMDELRFSGYEFE